MRIPDGVLPAELASSVAVVTRKAGLTPWHERLLSAIERIADELQQANENPGVPTRRRKEQPDA